MRYSQISKICAFCGKSFTVHKYRELIARFCSYVCYHTASRGRPSCKISDCGRQHLGHGFCNRHYLRFKRHGDPLGGAWRVARPTRLTNTQRPSREIIKRLCAVCGAQIRRRKYCSLKCSGVGRRKPFIIKNGYKKLLFPEHDRSDRYGYVFEHILVLESKINRQLKKSEVCHHIDGNKLNNDATNLVVCKNNSEHIKQYHHRKKSTQCVVNQS